MGKSLMTFLGSPPRAGRVLRCVGAALGMTVILSATAYAGADNGPDSFKGPTFRKGMWRFVRTLELVVSEKLHQRLMEREMTRCVDPTVSMKQTFSSPAVGGCTSSQPEHAGDRYTFANRCDYMGPVRTVITVQNDESYTELNEMKVGGTYPKVDYVVAKRIGDCPEEGGPARKPSAALIQGMDVTPHRSAAALIQN